jgi:hypothetical protein
MKKKKNYKFKLYQMVNGKKVNYGSTPSINFARASVKRQREKGIEAFWIPCIYK